MSIRADLRRAVFGKGVAHRPPEWRTRDWRIRQANENLTHILNDWSSWKTSFGRKVSFDF